VPQQIEIPFERTKKAWSTQTITALLSLVPSSSVERYEAEIASLIASSIEEATLKLRLLMKGEHLSRRDVATSKAELERETLISEAIENDVSDDIKISA
jgi:hypothetical protein